jgi:hypothetical protein
MIEHIYDDDGMCWCDPTKHVIETQQDMLDIFGEVFKDMAIPCNIWAHQEGN